jgi:hypothetical protein
MNGGRSYRSLPVKVWNVFVAFSVLAITGGLLYGAGEISGGTLTIGLLCALVAFVPWAVLQLDPKGLGEVSSYDQHEEKRAKDRREGS